MFDFQTDKNVKLPKDINIKSQGDLNSLLYSLFGYHLHSLIEYDLDKKENIKLTFFD
jgi:hypothetical protein